MYYIALYCRFFCIDFFNVDDLSVGNNVIEFFCYVNIGVFCNNFLFLLAFECDNLSITT